MFNIFQKKVAILAYHSIGGGNERLSLPTEVFEKHLRFLKSHFEIITLDDVVDYVNGRKNFRRAIALTFDDGYKDFRTVALPILERYDAPAVVFVISQNVNPVTKGKTLELLSKDDLQELGRHPLVTIGSHTRTHPRLSEISSEKQKQEIFISKNEIEEIIGKQVDYFAYPKGLFNDNARAYVQVAGYKAAFTTHQSFVKTGDDLYVLPRIGIWPSDSVFKLRLRLFFRRF